MTAMLAVPGITYNNWYADLGATNHVTCDAKDMTSKIEYNGGEQLLMGNGVGINILHNGNIDLQ